MSVNERPLPRKSPVRLSVALILIIAVTFLALQILAGVIFLKAPAVTSQQEARPRCKMKVVFILRDGANAPPQDEGLKLLAPTSS